MLMTPIVGTLDNSNVLRVLHCVPIAGLLDKTLAPASAAPNSLT